MSEAGISMMKYLSDKEMAVSEDFYQTSQKEWFGNANTVFTLRMVPIVLLSLAVFSSHDDSEAALLIKIQDIIKIYSQLLIVFTMKVILHIPESPKLVKHQNSGRLNQ